MTFETSHSTLTLCMAVLGILGLSATTTPTASAQDLNMPPEVRTEGRRRMAECESHVHGERWAIAVDCYSSLYEFMREHSLPRAPMALLNVGRSLARIPGRESDARAALQRFLDESTALAAGEDAADVRERRSDAVALIAELDARLRDRPTTEPAPTTSPPLAQSRISPIGPVVLGVGIATLLAGTVVGGLSLAEASNFRSMCADLERCDPTLRPQYDSMRTLSGVADALLVGGAVVTALGLVLTFTLSESTESVATAGVTCGPDGCRTFARWTW